MHPKSVNGFQTVEYWALSGSLDIGCQDRLVKVMRLWLVLNIIVMMRRRMSRKLVGMRMKCVCGMVRRFNLSVISIETFCAITSYEIAVLPQRNQRHSKCDHIIRSKFQLMKEGAPFFSILICQRDVFLNFRCKTDRHIYSLLNHNLLKFN